MKNKIALNCRINKKFIFEILLLILIIGIGIYFRINNLYKGSLSYDEIASFSAAFQDFPFGITEFLGKYDTHPPFYYFILHFWMKVFGTSEIPLRALSVLFGVLCIPAVYLAGKKFFSAGTGLTAAALLSFNSFHIFYSQTIRLYALVALLSAISIYFLLKVMRNPGHKTFLGFSAISLALLYTSNLAPIFIFSELIIIITFFIIKNNFTELKRFIFYQFFCGVLYLPHLFLLLKQVKNHELMFFSKGTIHSLTIQVQNLLIPVLHKFLPDFKNYLKDNFFPIFYMLFVNIPLVIFGISFIKTLIERKKESLTIIALIFLFLVFEFILAFNQKIPLISRYAVFILPLLLIVLAQGLFSFKKKFIYIPLTISIIAISSLYLFFIPSSPLHLVKSRFFNKVAKILTANNINKNDMVLSASIGTNFLKEYYSTYYKIDAKIPRLQSTFFLFRKDYEDLKFIGDREFVSGLNKENLKYKLLPYFKEPEPSEKFKIYAGEKFLSKIPAGGRIFLISYQPTSSYYKEFFSDEIPESKYLGNRIKIAEMFSSKFSRDLKKICEKNLNLVKSIKEGSLEVYIYEKELVAGEN